MKRRQLIRQLTKGGCVLLPSGANHDIYVNPKTGQKQPVPRHTEIEDTLARHIRKCLGLD